jgi:anti-anti-sigma factor
MGQELLDVFGRATAKLKGFSAHAVEVPGADGGLRVVLEGHLDGEAAHATLDPLVALVDAWHGSPQVTVALEGLVYISSMGIGMLARAAVAARKRGFSLHLEAPQPSVFKVLDLLGIPQYIPVVAAGRKE